MLFKKSPEKTLKNICREIASEEWEGFILDLKNNDTNFNFTEFLKDFEVYKNYFNRMSHDLSLEMAKKLTTPTAEGKTFVENFHDEIMKLYWVYNKEDYIESIKYSRLSNLLTPEIIEEISIILDNEITPELLDEQFFSIYGIYSTPNSADLLASLKRYRQKNIGWSREFYLDRMKNENLNVKVLDDQAGYFVFETEDYEACKALGPQAWCIVQSKYFFDMYTGNNRRQYIVMKFDDSISDNFSLIGLTTDNTGRVTDSYDRNNTLTPNNMVDIFNFPSY